jgi:MoxR-like ATPase
MSVKLNSKFQSIESELNSFFVERQAVIRGLLLATLSQTNILLLGTPGTAKSMIIERWNAHIKNSKFFQRLITRFTVPDELFGPFSMNGIKEDRFYRIFSGKLPEANTAFLDEIFKGSSGILNTLLSILNERTFYNEGGAAIKVPLFTLAAASNEVPDKDDKLDAVYDRFLLKYDVKSIREDSNFLKMLTSDLYEVTTTISIEDIAKAQNDAAALTIPEETAKSFLDLRAHLRNAGVMMSDRAFKLMAKIVKAEAWINGHTEVTTDDLEVLQHACWKDPDHIKKVQLLVLDVISPELYRIQKEYNDCLEILETFWKNGTADKKQTDNAVEVTKKLKDSKVRMSRYRDELKKSHKVTARVDEMLASVDHNLKEIFVKVLGIEA